MAYSDIPRLLPLRLASAILIAWGFEFHGWWGILGCLWALRDAHNQLTLGLNGWDCHSLLVKGGASGQICKVAGEQRVPRSTLDASMVIVVMCASVSRVGGESTVDMDGG